MSPVASHTLGVDLAAGEDTTATCLIDWRTPRPRIEPPLVGRDDDAIVREVGRARLVGIDAPFGWPEPFRRAVIAHQARRPWPGRGEPLEAFRQELRLRRTDIVVKEEVGVTPLSVSSDKIGVTAFRRALLLDRLSPNPPVGPVGRHQT
ncbi:MAG: DUF429 domain-containing protein, partial [Thermoleophilaceae bacterium]